MKKLSFDNMPKGGFDYALLSSDVITELLKSSKKISRKEKIPNSILDFIENDTNWKVPQIINTSIEEINSQKRTLNNKKLLYFFTQKRINLHIIELNNKYSLIFSSLFLFDSLNANLSILSARLVNGRWPKVSVPLLALFVFVNSSIDIFI